MGVLELPIMLLLSFEEFLAIVHMIKQWLK
jgi:hypothetical protein